MNHKSLRTIRRKNGEREPSVAVISLNCQQTIKKTLSSVKNFKEIIVVDNGSVDNTVKIASQYTKNIFLCKVKNLKTLRELALKKISSQWVFFIDSDEILTEKNRKRLLNLWHKNKASYDGFWLARRNYYGGKKDNYLKYGSFYPDFQLRLFKKNYHYKNTPHEQPNIPLKKTFYCRDVEIYHYQNRDKIFSILGVTRLKDLSKMYGRDLQNKGIFYLLFNSFFRFVDLFFVSLTRGKGLLDGWRGVMAAFNFASHVSLIYLWAILYKIRRVL